MSFGKSFDEAFKPAMASSQAGTFDALKEKIKQDTEKAKESNKVANNLSIVAEVAKSADPETQQLIAKLIGDDTKSWDSESSDSLVKLAIANSKDKKDFDQTMTQEKYKSGMLGVTEVIKSLADRGGTFADGTPITATSLQDFGKSASDRLMANIGMMSTQPSSISSPYGLEQRIGQSTQEMSNQTSKKSNGGGLMDAPIRSKASFKAEEKSASDTATAEKTSQGTYRFMQQFDRSIKELRAFDPEFDKVGAGGWLSRKQALIGEKLDELPETSALKIQVLPMANAMAREIEGGRVTDQDRKIYADSFANGVNNPNVTNMRLMSQSLIGLLDKGGNENGKITSQLQQLAKSDTDMFKGVIMQVLEDYPELASQIYGEGFEVSE